MSFLHHHKILFGIIVTLGILLYAAFNVWVYRSATDGNTPLRKEVWQTVTKSSAGFQAMTGPGPVITSSSPIPTPRPTGPGEYACSPDGDCNVYSNEMRRQYCTQTYADLQCLDQCGDKSKLCTK